MRLAVLLVLVLCVVLSAADRRRSGRDDRDEQHPRSDVGDRRHHHHQDDRRRHHYRDGDDDDDDDGDDEGDHDADHHHHHRFVELADADRSHWREDRDHEHRGRPDAGERDHRKGHDNRHDAQKNGKKNGKKDGLKTSDGRRGGDGEHHQERREDRHHRSERHQTRGGDAPSKMNHSKNSKKAHHQSDQRTAERRPVQPDLAETARESAAEPSAPEPARSSEVTPSAAEEKSLSPAAESLAAALAAEEVDTALSDGQQDQQDTESEPLPPPHQDVAAMARYIVHVSDWASMATVSTREPTRGMPFANVFSVCDGTRYRSTGIPYLYITDMDISVQDLRVNNSASLAMSLAQTSFCKKRGYDPEDPLCAHVILTGRVLQVDDQDPEFVFARDALFSRHPEMSGWPVGHHFFVAKLDIQNIIVLDFFGGAKTVPVSEYFATNPFKVHPRRANML